MHKMTADIVPIPACIHRGRHATPDNNDPLVNSEEYWRQLSKDRIMCRRKPFDCRLPNDQKLSVLQ